MKEVTVTTLITVIIQNVTVWKANLIADWCDENDLSCFPNEKMNEASVYDASMEQYNNLLKFLKEKEIKQ